MPRMPYFGGNIASAATVYAPPPAPSFMESMLGGGGGGDVARGLGSAIGRAFYNPEHDPDVQQARYHKVRADGVIHENQEAVRAMEARRRMGDVMGEYQERTLPNTPLSAVMQAISGAYQQAVAEGGDPAALTPLVQAFALSLGDRADQAMSMINSAIGGRYLGDNQTPSLEAQRVKVEDDQAHDKVKHDGELAMRKYGFDTQASTSRYATDVGAITSRRGQDVSAATARRGQDLTDQRARQPAPVTETKVETVLPAVEADPGSRGFFGLGKRPATPGSPATRKTVTTRGSSPIQDAAGGGGPPQPGAKKAPDGNWYIPDPARPGKYLKVG